MGIHFQRNRFVGAAAQETCNVLGGEFFQSQLFVLDDADEFTEQEPVRECLVGNHCVHEREYCAVAAPKPFPSDFGIDDATRSCIPEKCMRCSRGTSSLDHLRENLAATARPLNTSVSLGTYLVSISRSSTLTQEHRLIVAPRIN